MTVRTLPQRSPLAAGWTLDPEVVFLNHGSFGACPRDVLVAQVELRGRMEKNPMHFFMRELEGLLDEARAEVAAFIGARPHDLAFVPNASTGVAIVLASLRLEPGDELLTTSHAYNAVVQAMERKAEQTGARVVIAKLPFPIDGQQPVIDAVMDAVTQKTRLVVVDHVTSPTALVLPVEELVKACAARGVDVLVDGAHAPGMLALDVDAVGAAFYTGNLHKWVCAPKGAAFLHVRRDKQASIVPVVTSHGRSDPRTHRTRFQLELDWTGTHDPSALLSVPAALRTLADMVPGGWPEVRARNHTLAIRARDILCAALGVAPPAPDAMLGSMAAIPLPARGGPPVPRSPFEPDPLQTALFEKHGIEVPIMPWPALGTRLVRVSAQLYDDVGEYAYLAAALREELG